jgi:trehalose 6-phosphate synthase
VLILSQFAGAAEEMSEAIIINPHDADWIAEALHEALTMPLPERQRRHEALTAKVRASSAKAYCERFLGALREAKPASEPVAVAPTVARAAKAASSV